MVKVREITVAQLPFTPASIYLWGEYSAGVFRQKHGSPGYGIRIQIGERRTGGRVQTSWDYFRTDESGLIIESPRGWGREYNKKVRLIDIDEVEKRLKEGK